MNKIKLAIVSVFALIGIFSMVPNYVHASDVTNTIQQGVTSVGGNGAGNTTDLPTRVKGIVDIFLFIIGVLAVIMIVIGGLRYVISGGEAGAVKNAKNTILYAVVGLVVAILAYAIVNFVLKSFK